MTTPLPPEREGSSRHRRPGEGLSDKSYDLLPTKRSRELRNNATPAERKLWSVLKNRQLSGVRFNRQVVIGPYICDLVARSAKLVVEVDGGQHGDAARYDGARTVFLEAKGYRVLRFWNNDVLSNIDGVMETIGHALEYAPPAIAGGVEARSAEDERLLYASEDLPSPARLGRVDPSRSGGRG